MRAVGYPLLVPSVPWDFSHSHISVKRDLMVRSLLFQAAHLNLRSYRRLVVH